MPGQVICKGCGEEVEAKRIDRKWCDSCRTKNAEKYQKEYDERKKGKCRDCGRDIGRRAMRCRQCDNKYRPRANGNQHQSWRGGFTKTKEGYVYRRVKQLGYKGHPYRAEHILVWEETHNKSLPKGWVVHHLNGIKDDNRPENLLALPRGEHHKHPFPSIKPYQERILALERQLVAIRDKRISE